MESALSDEHFDGSDAEGDSIPKQEAPPVLDDIPEPEVQEEEGDNLELQMKAFKGILNSIFHSNSYSRGGYRVGTSCRLPCRSFANTHRREKQKRSVFGS